MKPNQGHRSAPSLQISCCCFKGLYSLCWTHFNTVIVAQNYTFVMWVSLDCIIHQDYQRARTTSIFILRLRFLSGMQAAVWIVGYLTASLLLQYLIVSVRSLHILHLSAWLIWFLLTVQTHMVRSIWDCKLPLSVSVRLDGVSSDGIETWAGPSDHSEKQVTWWRMDDWFDIWQKGTSIFLFNTVYS